MFAIRNGVFETNSSSSHAICIKNTNTNSALDLHDRIDPNGNMLFLEDDLVFYRSPFRVLMSPYEKLRYAIAHASMYDPEEAAAYISSLEAIVRRYNQGFNHFCFELNAGGYCKYGGLEDYILLRWLEDHDVPMEDFLTQDKYFVVCDGDEYNIFRDMVLCGLVDRSKIQIYGGMMYEFD